MKKLFVKKCIPWNKGRKGVQEGWNKGKNHSKETREKIKRALLKRYKNGMIPWNKNKKHTKISGKNNCNWIGGGWRYWRKQALERDNYACKKCGFNEYKNILLVDHIKPKSIYPHLKKELSNLITLCPNCHAIKTINEQKEIICFKKRINSVKLLKKSSKDNTEPSSKG